MSLMKAEYNRCDRWERLGEANLLTITWGVTML